MKRIKSIPSKRGKSGKNSINPHDEISQSDTIKEEAEVTTVSNTKLSAYKIAKKPRIQKGDVDASIPTIKRTHIPIQYDSQISKEIAAKPDLLPNNNEMQVKESKFGNFTNAHNWQRVLQNLKDMRKNSDAPVDSMGCQQCVDIKGEPKDMRYQTLLALMLSSQTKDQITHAAMLRLHEHGCTVETVLNTSDEKLGELIYPVSFWKKKVQYIKNASRIMKAEYGNDIPNTVQELCKLPGVGPKMAHLCMQIAWNRVTGIGVDTHVHRISNRLGWVNTKTPEETRKSLESLFPIELWVELNQLLVGFGQQICKPVKPHCFKCLNREICPFGIKYVKGKI